MINSYGIALLQRNEETGLYEVLIVQKRNTYAYVDFINQKFRTEEDLIHLFENMTNDEKFLILSLDFDKLYFKYSLMSESYLEVYATAIRAKYDGLKRKFEKNARRFKFKTLINIANKSIPELWELPRGRKLNISEAPINCAQREFFEETGISPDNYTQFGKSFTIVQDNIYSIQYFFALSIGVRPKLNIFNYHQVSEVKNIQFVPLKDFQFYNIYAKDKIKKVIQKFSKNHLKSYS